jgi:hypothetical protein
MVNYLVNFFVTWITHFESVLPSISSRHELIHYRATKKSTSCSTSPQQIHNESNKWSVIFCLLKITFMILMHAYQTLLFPDGSLELRKLMMRIRIARRFSTTSLQEVANASHNASHQLLTPGCLVLMLQTLLALTVDLLNLFQSAKMHQSTKSMMMMMMKMIMMRNQFRVIRWLTCSIVATKQNHSIIGDSTIDSNAWSLMMIVISYNIHLGVFHQHRLSSVAEPSLIIFGTNYLTFLKIAVRRRINYGWKRFGYI